MLGNYDDDADLPAVGTAMGQKRVRFPLEIEDQSIEELEEGKLKEGMIKSENGIKVKRADKVILKREEGESQPRRTITNPSLAGFINRFKQSQLNPEEKVRQARWSNRLDSQELARLASLKPRLSAGDEFIEIVEGGKGEKAGGGIFGARTALLQRAHVPRVKRASIDRLNDVLDKKIRVRQAEKLTKGKRLRQNLVQDETLFNPKIVRKESMEEEVELRSESDEEEEDAKAVWAEEELQIEASIPRLRKIVPHVDSSSESSEPEVEDAINQQGESEHEEEDLIDTLADIDEITFGEPKKPKWKASDFFDEEAESEEEDSDDGTDEEGDISKKGKQNKKQKKKQNISSKKEDEQIDEKAIAEELSGFIVNDDTEVAAHSVQQVHQQLQQKDDEAQLEALLRRFGSAAEGMARSTSRIEAKYKVRHSRKAEALPAGGPSAFRLLISDELHETVRYSDHLCGQDDEDHYGLGEDRGEEMNENEPEGMQRPEGFTIDLTMEETRPVAKKRSKPALQMDARVAQRIQQAEQE